MAKKAQVLAITAIVLSGLTLFPLVASAEEGLIPSWIKTVTGFWSNDQVSDSEFISALEFLITKGIIEVYTQDPIVKELQDENEQLKTEILALTSLFVSLQAMQGSTQISGTPQIEAIQIVGYDATDSAELVGHEGTIMLASSGGVANNAKTAGERIAIYVKGRT